MRICENCGNKHDGIYASGRFCSLRCVKLFAGKTSRTLINREKTRKALIKKPYETNCAYCGEIFSLTGTGKKKTAKFCSVSCRTKYRNKYENLAHKGGLAAAKKRVKRSKNEVYFAELCKKEFNNVLTNKSVFNGWDADVIIPIFKIAVLWNGKWHYEKITKKHSVKQVKNRDRIKLNEIWKCGYSPYIIRDMGRYNKKFVEKEFQKFMKYIARWTGVVPAVSHKHDDADSISARATTWRTQIGLFC